MNTTTKVGLMAAMLVLGLVAFSGSASATAQPNELAAVAINDGGGGSDGGPIINCNLLPLWDLAWCVEHQAANAGWALQRWARCNVIGGPACF